MRARAGQFARTVTLGLVLLAAPTIGAQALSPSSATIALPPTAAPFWSRRLTGYLATADGVRLRYSVLLPRGAGPFPTIVNYSGYDPGAIGGAAYLGGDTAMSVNLDRTLLEHGYAVLGVNARGTGCSEGTFEFLGASYGRDGHDAVEFIATQPWSNGAVGMANWSWAGMSQLATASTRPPHLSAIAPGMVVADARLDSWAPGGVPAPAFVAQWWNYLHERWATVRRSAEAEQDATCLGQLERNILTAEANNLSNVILRHPLRDAYIEQRHLAAHTADITVPVLSMTSFQDEAVTSRDGHYQDTLDPRRLWVVQTNGGHDLYESRRFRDVLVAFFDHFVRGEANGFERRPHAEIWIESHSRGKEHERQEGVTPGFVVTGEDASPQVRAMHFSLAAGGLLTQSAQPRSGRDCFSYPMVGATVDADEDPDLDRWGPLGVGWRAGSLAYTTPPLPGTLLAYGTASANLWISLTSTDADLAVTLTEVRPDGQEMYVQRGWLRLSNRLQDEQQATELRPFPLDQPETMTAMTPAVAALARIELTKFAHAFRRGSRIRLWIDAPSATGSYGFAPLAVPARISLWHDPAHPSQLVLGILDGATVPAQRPACGSVLKQPCRPDPLASSRLHPTAPLQKD